MVRTGKFTLCSGSIIFRNIFYRRVFLVNDFKYRMTEQFNLENRIRNATQNKSSETLNGNYELGLFELDFPKCKTLIDFTNILLEYENVTGLQHPQDQVYIVPNTWAGILIKSPFSTTDTIR